MLQNQDYAIFLNFIHISKRLKPELEINGISTSEIAKLAKDLDVYVLVGMPEKDAKDPDSRYISVAVIGPEGIIGRYRKIAVAPPPIWTEQICGFKFGNELPVFETRYGPIGVQICAAFSLAQEIRFNPQFEVPAPPGESGFCVIELVEDIGGFDIRLN